MEKVCQERVMVDGLDFNNAFSRRPREDAGRNRAALAEFRRTHGTPSNKDRPEFCSLFAAPGALAKSRSLPEV
jgi:hypothetical protein